MKDLILVVADKNMHFALRGALNRPEALGIRPIIVEFFVHPGRDGGVRKSGAELLALKRSAANHGMIVLDYEGCGAASPAGNVEAELTQRLVPKWGANGQALVIEPELDVWLWGAENALKTALSWNHPASIRDWLRGRGYALGEHEKPDRPKEALEAVLRELRLPRSSALYEELAGKLSLRRCSDPAFGRLRATLQRWFPAV
jgi:hypothetical protein